MDSPNVDRLVRLAQTDAHLQIAVRSLERANAILQEPAAMRLRADNPELQEYAGSILAATAELHRARLFTADDLKAIRVRR